MFELLIVVVGVIWLFRSAKEIRENRKEEQRRKSTPFRFSNRLTKEDFEFLVHDTAKSIKRIKDISIVDSIVTCEVISQSGLSSWDFEVDFNDYGALTGKYWSESDNNDSDIPNQFAERLQVRIKQFSNDLNRSQRSYEGSKKVNNQELKNKTYCTNCGEKIEPVESKYCGYCGTRLK